jgi:hypothetical protein
MDKAELIRRIEKKQADIDKITRRVQKWDKGLSAEDEQAAMSLNWKELTQYAQSHNYPYEKENALSEYRRALNDLRDANTTLAKYKNQLAVIESKDQITKIQVIVDFLELWKGSVRNYIAVNMTKLLEYYELDRQRCDLQNHKYTYLKDHTEEDYRAKVAAMKEQLKELEEDINPLTREVYSKNSSDRIDHEALEKILAKDAEAKYWNLIEKVTKYTGEIIDASQLKVAGDGNLNGIIVGTQGKAKLETIVAGGYNTGRIVNVKRGPIAHYRVICNPVR